MDVLSIYYKSMTFSIKNVLGLSTTLINFHIRFIRFSALFWKSSLLFHSLRQFQFSYLCENWWRMTEPLCRSTSHLLCYSCMCSTYFMI